MKVSRRKNPHAEVYTASLNDIMFFLLLFFLIISTLVNPSVIKLTLPKAQSNEQALSKKTINLSITKEKNYFLNDKPVSFEALKTSLETSIHTMPDLTVIIRADNSLQIQDLVDVLDMGTKLRIKMILATKKE
jgi:biopolymer transport protein ExbD